MLDWQRRSKGRFAVKHLLFIFLALLAIPLFAEETAKPPQLKPEVKAELLEIKNAQLQTIVQMAVLDEQYRKRMQELATQRDGFTSKFNIAQTTALERSGIDKSKYMLSADTLEVSETPKPTDASKAKDKAESVKKQ
jgi:hypothetical protein